MPNPSARVSVNFRKPLDLAPQLTPEHLKPRPDRGLSPPPTGGTVESTILSLGLPYSNSGSIIGVAMSTAKKASIRRPTAKKGVAGKPIKRLSGSERSAKRTSTSIADRVIYDSPLKPRHLSRAEIESIVDEIFR